MPRRRCKELASSAVYHLTSRTAGRQLLFDEEAKGKFIQIMWNAAHFTGMEVISFCVMTNHFHILVRCPNPADPPADETFLARIKVLYPPAHVFHTLAREWTDQKRDAQSQPAAPPGSPAKEPTVAETACQRLLKRMGDISAFMKELKQAFSVWFNRKHSRHGTLWEGRFESNIILTGSRLEIVSAYDDLNPVRAGIVTDPALYPFNSYSAAVAGDKEIRKAIQSICGPADITWEAAQAQYRKLLYITGGSTHQAGKATIPAEDIKAVLEAGGELTLAQVLRIRIPHMTRGLAMGMRAELEAFFKRHRKYFGPNRLTCARKFRINCKELKAAMMCARDLQI